MMLYAKAQNPTSMSVANGMSHAVSTRRNATTNPVRPATTSPNCTFARRREWRVAPDQTGTNCVIAPMIVIQIHPANRRWRWASRPSPGTAFRCKPIPTRFPRRGRRARRRNVVTGPSSGLLVRLDVSRNRAHRAGYGLRTPDSTTEDVTLRGLDFFLTRAKGTSHRPASIQRRTRTDWIRRSTPNTFADTDTSVAGRSRVMVDCQLCDLPTPDPPVRGADVDGGFCCRGCWRWLVASRTWTIRRWTRSGTR